MILHHVKFQLQKVKGSPGCLEPSQGKDFKEAFTDKPILHVY